jgi:hypothetical protein
MVEDEAKNFGNLSSDFNTWFKTDGGHFEKRKKKFDIAAFCSALYLDPRFKHQLDQEQKVEAVRFLKGVWDKLNSFKISQRTKTSLAAKLPLVPLT